MKLYSILFLLAAILKLSDSCLVIRYSEPPACACKTLKLDSLNIRENRVPDNLLYNHVYSSTIKAPEIIVDDCFVQIYCEDGYELYIGDYSLDGFCNPFPQKWQVDTGNGIEQYKELKAVCALKTGCACPYVQLDASNIDVYLGENDSYKNNLQGYPIQAPEITQYKEDGCPHRRECPEGWQIFTVWDPMGQDLVDTIGNVTWTSDCEDPDEPYPWRMYYWRPTVLQSMSVRFLSAFCVAYDPW